ncbi:MAG: CHAT domain-containing protein [Bacteroidetes bacterium]|nr:CHAT domain-containing protein [Bacteroidota bacterium]
MSFRFVHFFTLIVYSVFLNAQFNGRTPNIRQSISEYNQLLHKSEGMSRNELIHLLTQNNLLQLHNFNLSYTNGIGEFIHFKNAFHYAIGRSDIPRSQTPAEYLVSVIQKYESEGKTRVGIVYYDAFVPGAETPSADFDPFSELQKPDKQRKEYRSLHAFMRIYYLSSQQLITHTSTATYKQLYALEIQMRDELNDDSGSQSVSARGAAISKAGEVETARVKPGALSRLSSILLPKPIRDGLIRDSINALIVIPYENIGQLPFLAFPFEKDTIKSAVADYMCVTIAPHLCNYNRVFGANQSRIGKQNAMVSRNPIIIGNPVYAQTAGMEFPDLPGAEDEARKVAAFLHTSPLLGKSARVDTVLHRLKNADFGYFATHAVPDYSNPAGKSFLALTPDIKHPTGWLNIEEIQEITNNRLKLVVLSACQTGIGKAYKNGYCNIGRGFFIAGTDNILMSLWNLNDRDMVPFMQTVMEELAKPQYFYPAENLRQAVLRYRRINPNPAVWAAMVKFGIDY